MECDICFRGHDANRLPFVCAVDAQNQVYQGRFQSLRLLFESEKLQADIDQAVTDSPQPSLDLMFVQQRQVQDRTDQILAAADKLRAEIQAARDEVRARKLALARRRSDLASVSGGLLDRRARQHHEVDKASQILRFRWSQSAQELAHTRAFLCSEAVRLYGLKRTKKGSTGRYDYHIGRVPVLDLATMDGAWAVVSLSRLLWLSPLSNCSPYSALSRGHLHVPGQRGTYSYASFSLPRHPSPSGNHPSSP